MTTTLTKAVKTNRRIRTRRWDTAEHLRTPEEMALYLEACREENDAQLVTPALGAIARAKR